MRTNTTPLPSEPAPAVKALRDRPAAGLTVREVARRYRVGEDKVRLWIRRGELRAINTAAVACARPRFVIPPEALSEFERRRAGALPPKPQRQCKRKSGTIDYYPDEPGSRGGR